MCEIFFINVMPLGGGAHKCRLGALN